MTTDSDELADLIDREKIRNCIMGLARGEDRRDAQLITAAFWANAMTDFGIFKGNFSQYLDWVVPGSAAVLLTQHKLGQIYIKLAGNVAQCETYVTSYHRVNTGEAHHDITIGGRYLDQMEKREGEWRISTRTMLYDWCQNFGISANWEQGLMGQPFRSEHYTGACANDFSYAFFGIRE